MTSITGMKRSIDNWKDYSPSCKKFRGEEDSYENWTKEDLIDWLKNVELTQEEEREQYRECTRDLKVGLMHMASAYKALLLRSDLEDPDWVSREIKTADIYMCQGLDIEYPYEEEQDI